MKKFNLDWKDKNDRLLMIAVPFFLVGVIINIYLIKDKN